MFNYVFSHLNSREQLTVLPGAAMCDSITGSSYDPSTPVSADILHIIYPKLTNFYFPHKFLCRDIPVVAVFALIVGSS